MLGLIQYMRSEIKPQTYNKNTILLLLLSLLLFLFKSIKNYENKFALDEEFSFNLLKL